MGKWTVLLRRYFGGSEGKSEFLAVTLRLELSLNFSQLWLALGRTHLSLCATEALLHKVQYTTQNFTLFWALEMSLFVCLEREKSRC